MNAVDLLLVGLVLGTVLAAAVFAGYMAFTTLRTLTVQIKRLCDVLGPVLDGNDLSKMLQVFHLLSQQGIDIGRKVEALDKTVQVFLQRAFMAQPESTLAATSTAGSGVYPYREEEAASRDTADKNRKNGIETDESRVSTSPSEEIPARDVF